MSSSSIQSPYDFVKPESIRSRDLMKSIIDELDEILVDMGKYSSKDELMKDALCALLRVKSELKKGVAIELYKKGAVSLSRAYSA